MSSVKHPRARGNLALFRRGTFASPLRRAVAIVSLGCLVSALGPERAAAQVTVTRTGSENPMKEIATSTIYGGLAGLLLGGATALAVEDNEDSIIKWFFVGGTFFGFGYGIYHVSRRPVPRALLGFDPTGRSRIGVPLPRLTLSHSGDSALSVTLLSLTF